MMLTKSIIQCSLVGITTSSQFIEQFKKIRAASMCTLSLTNAVLFYCCPKIVAT